MSHIAHRSGYASLVERLNKFPQGAPPAEYLNRILSILVSEREAELLAKLPIRPFSAAKAAARWQMSEVEALKILENLADRGMLVDMLQGSTMMYILPPPMAGFFEFSMMRMHDDIDQQALAELYYQYLNQEEDFIRELFAVGETHLGRAFVNEPVLGAVNEALVLDYERASAVISSARAIGVSTCYCRHKMQHVGRDCDAPKEICMTFNNTAASLVRHGHARAVEVRECLDLLAQAYENNLVQFGDNVRENVNFICNCCSCCCEALLAQKRFGAMHPVHTTNFIPVIDHQICTGCGRCVKVCPVEALELGAKAQLNQEICLGCGVCVRNCPSNAIALQPRESRVVTPLNSTHKAVMMAIERGKLQELVMDNAVLWNHRALAALIGVILRTPH